VKTAAGQISTGAEKKAQRGSVRALAVLYTRTKNKTATTNRTMASHPLGAILTLPLRPGLLSC
jgi:hypothetical protein